MRLSRQQIGEIVTAFKGGEPQAQIARRFNVDDSTIRYHVQKYEASYLYSSGVYSLIKVEVQHECIHPSVVCSVCGKRHDTIRREERTRIQELEQELIRYKNGGGSSAV